MRTGMKTFYSPRKRKRNSQDMLKLGRYDFRRSTIDSKARLLKSGKRCITTKQYKQKEKGLHLINLHGYKGPYPWSHAERMNILKLAAGFKWMHSAAFLSGGYLSVSILDDFAEHNKEEIGLKLHLTEWQMTWLKIQIIQKSTIEHQASRKEVYIGDHLECIVGGHSFTAGAFVRLSGGDDVYILTACHNHFKPGDTVELWKSGRCFIRNCTVHITVYEKTKTSRYDCALIRVPKRSRIQPVNTCLWLNYPKSLICPRNDNTHENNGMLCFKFKDRHRQMPPGSIMEGTWEGTTGYIGIQHADNMKEYTRLGESGTVIAIDQLEQPTNVYGLGIVFGNIKDETAQGGTIFTTLLTPLADSLTRLERKLGQDIFLV